MLWADISVFLAVMSLKFIYFHRTITPKSVFNKAFASVSRIVFVLR